jgi:ribosomal protein S18 acetylase RimI-like enzyme
MIGGIYFTLSPGELKISRLVVHPDYFGRGIVTSLLAEVKGKTGSHHRILVSTAEKNLPAIAVYHKFGYKMISRDVLPDGLVLVRLQKEIAK